MTNASQTKAAIQPILKFLLYSSIWFRQNQLFFHSLSRALCVYLYLVSAMQCIINSISNTYSTLKRLYAVQPMHKLHYKWVLSSLSRFSILIDLHSTFDFYSLFFSFLFYQIIPFPSMYVCARGFVRPFFFFCVFFPFLIVVVVVMTFLFSSALHFS